MVRPKAKGVAMRLTAATLLLVCSVGVYLLCFRTLSDAYIMSHGWKGGGGGRSCLDILDFRGGAMRLHEDILYINDVPFGRIVERKYRAYADSYIDVLSETGETCTYWGKWEN